MEDFTGSSVLMKQPYEVQQLAADMQNDLHHYSAYRVENVVAVNGARVVFKAFKYDGAKRREYMAIKAVRLDSSLQQQPHQPRMASDQKSIEMEMKILRTLASSNNYAASEVMRRNIVNYVDSCYTHKYLFLVTQWCEGGDLFDYLHSALQKNCNELSRPEELRKMIQWFSALVSSVALVHRKGFAHRDLSPENILLGYSNPKNTSPTVKLHDFGLACSARRQNRPVGKLMYAAPELLAPVPVYDPQAADIWSLGIILFSMMSKHAPMNSARAGDAHFHAFCQDRAAYVDLLLSSQQLEHTMSPEAKDLFLKMTTIDPAKRITIEGVLEHPFINTKPSLGIKMDFVSRRRARSLESPPPTIWKKDGPHRVRQKVQQTMRELAGVMLKQTAGTIV